jgi:farnesyl-diphosphate farnesyltransferase
VRTETGVTFRRLRGSVLRSVSRSFYISVALLPRKLRDPVALAYLLARASDTIADTTGIATDLRMEKLRLLTRAIQTPADREAIAELGASLVPLQKNKNEQTLIELIPACLDWLDQIDSDDREEIQSVLEKINHGQHKDLQTFRDPNQVVALQQSADLDEYTYLVAGSAGEFWTRLCFAHLRRFSKRTENEMLELGRTYGMGLQLINILRDAGPDLRAGRCYFPHEELAAARMEPAQILREPQRFQPIYRNWRNKAEEGVRAGIDYGRSIRNRRVRTATILPALIGARTLALLREAGATALHRQIKVSRKEVRSIIARLAITLGSRSQIEEMFRELSR